MKRLILIFSAIAFINACVMLEEYDQSVQGGAETENGLSGVEIPEVLHASMTDGNEAKDSVKTRTHVQGKSVLWNNGDAISYFAVNQHNMKYKFDGEDGTALADFTKVEETGSEQSVVVYSKAVYPYDAATAYVYEDGVEKLTVNYPSTQRYAQNSFGNGANLMVASGKTNADEDLYFRNACGYLVIKLYDTEGRKVKRISVTPLGTEKIAGKATVVASNDEAPVITMTDNASASVTLDCSNGGAGVALGADAEHATEFWFALPPVTLNGFKILVTPTKGQSFEMETSKQVDIIRNEVQPMAPLKYTPNTQTPNQLFYTINNDSKEPIQFFEGMKQLFDANITAHYYDENTQKFIIECDAPITEIKDNAFRRQVGSILLTSVSLPSQLKTIGGYAFYLNDLEDIIIPGTVTLIKDHAFRNNRLYRIHFLWGEEELEIRDCDNYLSDGYGAFNDSDFEYIYIDRNIRFKDDEGGTYNITYIGMFKHSVGKTDVVELGPNVTTITNAMLACLSIKKMVIPGNITHIEKNAFINNYYLEELVFLPNPDGTPLTIDPSEITSIAGPFYLQESKDSLKTIRLNREINYTLDVIDSKDKGVFAERKALKTLEIGEQVKTLSDYMFASSKVLTSVTLPEGITSIGKYAFYDCNSLTSINIRSKVTFIDEGTFEDCDALTSVTFPSTLTSIGKKAFYNSDGLASIKIPSSVSCIGDSVFENCDALASVTIPSTLTSIGDSAFKNCDGLKSVTVSTSKLGTNMFDDCNNLATVTIDGTLDAINVDAFTGCSKLSTLNISGSVETIANGAFDSFNLTSLNISGHVGTIGANAFDDNDKMTTFTVSGSIGTIGVSAFEDSDALRTVNVTGTVNQVCAYAFSDCDNVSTLSIRANIVEDRAYEDMDGLISATLYGTTVGNGVFYDCNSLQTVIIDGGVNSIGNDAFYNCNQLSSVTFNASSNTLTIGYQPSTTDDLGPFYQSPLATINLNRNIEPSAVYKTQLDAWDMGIFTNKHYNNTNLTTTVTLGSNVKTIWPWMFSCVRMQNIEIPASVTSIGEEAFSYCYVLDTVTCNGTTAPTLGTNVFYDSNKLNYIYVPSGSLSSYQSKWSQCKDLLVVKSAQ